MPKNINFIFVFGVDCGVSKGRVNMKEMSLSLYSLECATFFMFITRTKAFNMSISMCVCVCVKG